ncbi:MAG: hypothetical protein LBS54_08225 [Dysgonamonadaceae bacterium]|jgi:hypothetical protein|nr:hypothetical protein [Dysgonamonadaceae bacterium]
MNVLSKIKPRFSYLVLALSIMALFVACNEGEGFGGRASVEGYVYEVFHHDDNYSFRADTVKAIGTKVYITANDDNQVLDDIDTGPDGYFRFDYLRKGDYRVYVVSEDQWKNKTPEFQNVKVGKSGTVVTPTLYYHKGDIYNTAMIKGRVWAKYYDTAEDEFVKIKGQDSIPLFEERVYLRNIGENMDKAQERPTDNGTFIFKELRPYSTYEVYMGETIKYRPDLSFKKISVATPVQTVQVGEPYKYYPLEGEPELSFTIIVNL